VFYLVFDKVKVIFMCPHVITIEEDSETQVQKWLKDKFGCFVAFDDHKVSSCNPQTIWNFIQ